MKTLTPQQLTRIEANFKRGKVKYIILHGVVGWGLLSATLFVIFTYLTEGKSSPRDIILPFILFPISGIWWGLWAWRESKRAIDRATHKD